MLARRGVQSPIASPATAISHDGHPCCVTAYGSNRGFRRSGAGRFPGKSPAFRFRFRFRFRCLSQTLTALLSPPSEAALRCSLRRRHWAPAPAGLPSTQPIRQWWRRPAAAAEEREKHMESEKRAGIPASCVSEIAVVHGGYGGK